jgi:Zn-dependent peptidase ImmA (M78 family)
MSAVAIDFQPMMRRVEWTAWNTIRRCMSAKELSSLPLPIPVEQWIEGPLGLSFSIADLSSLGKDVLGMARTQTGEIIVSETLVTKEARFRFTAAHELGHLLLHAKIAADFRDFSSGDFLERKIEREADRFAAAFLVPIPALNQEYPRYAADAGHEAEALLWSVATGDEVAVSAFRSQVVPRIARRFGVSHSSATRRFGDVLLPSGRRALPFEAINKVLSAGVAETTPRAM